MVRASCPVLVIHEDDNFRKSLVAALDERNFTVTVAAIGDEALETLRERRFRVVLLQLKVREDHRGTAELEALREMRGEVGCGVIVLTDPDPALREQARWADETLLRPVDAAYVAQRAQTYCP